MKFVKATGIGIKEIRLVCSIRKCKWVMFLFGLHRDECKCVISCIRNEEEDSAIDCDVKIKVEKVKETTKCWGFYP